MLKKLLYLALFWMGLFLFFRILFLFYQQSGGAEVATGDYFMVCLYAIHLDLSATSYLMIIPFLVLSIKLFTVSKIPGRIMDIYHYIIIPVCILLLLANMPLYQSWGTLINRRALAFAADPVEMLASMTTLSLISSLFAAGLLSLFFIKIYQQIHPVVKRSDRIPYNIIVILTSAILLFTALRGGWQLIPINESTASFSIRQLLNDAAVNPLWHLANNVSKSRLTGKNPYEELPSETAENLRNSLFVKANCNVNILKTERPNIVLILLESFTADILGSLNGESEVAPFLDQLCDSSLLFTNIYSSGRRTDQALPSVFAGFPAQPEHSVMRFTDKAAALPSMPVLLAKQGYHLSFYYGGETGFSNMGAYLNNNGFSRIITKDDFSSDEMNSKWGAHDESVLRKQLQDLKNEKQPFFSSLLTLTSHEPFEIPRKDYFIINNESDKFRNAARYTDECLKEYFTAAATEPWFANTLFILVADHGHRLPKERDYLDPATHHIPMLFYGNVVKEEFRGKKWEKTGGQHDLPATLLQQLQLPYDIFTWSNSLTDTCRSGFAYVDFDGSLGWITDSSAFIYKSHSRKPVYIKGKEDDLYKKAAAYRQQLFKDFMNLETRKINN